MGDFWFLSEVVGCGGAGIAILVIKISTFLCVCVCWFLVLVGRNCSIVLLGL